MGLHHERTETAGCSIDTATGHDGLIVPAEES